MRSIITYVCNHVSRPLTARHSTISMTSSMRARYIVTNTTNDSSHHPFYNKDTLLLYSPVWNGRSTFLYTGPYVGRHGGQPIPPSYRRRILKVCTNGCVERPYNGGSQECSPPTLVQRLPSPKVPVLRSKSKGRCKDKELIDIDIENIENEMFVTLIVSTSGWE